MRASTRGASPPRDRIVDVVIMNTAAIRHCIDVYQRVSRPPCHLPRAAGRQRFVLVCAGHQAAGERRGGEQHRQEKQRAAEKRGGEEAVLSIADMVANHADEPQKRDRRNGMRPSATCTASRCGWSVNQTPASPGVVAIANWTRTSATISSTENTGPATAAARGVRIR